MENISKCPMCGVPVRVIRRDNGMADHYEALTDGEANYVPNPISPHLNNYLKGKRKGKRTVAVVGSAYTTGPWAPFGESGVEVWCENEMHIKPWVHVDGVTAWFQLHPKWSFEKEHRSNHREWLKKNWPFHIYMQRTFDNIPKSTAFPLREVQGLINVERGEERIEKIFTSSFAYMTALALQQKKFDRIELFGIELLLEGEYAYQREAMAYWIGKADGMGVDVWLPEQCDLLKRPLYAYEEVRKGNSGEIILPLEEGQDAG